MNPTFLLFHAEGVNDERNSVYRLILVPVIEGEMKDAQEFLFNPKAPFDFVMSDISEEQVLEAPSYEDQWPQVQAIFDRFEYAMCTAEGYSAHALYNTLTRLGVKFSSIKYFNAKAVCRRTMSEVSYSFDYLNYVLYKDSIPLMESVKIAQRWGELALRGLNEVAGESISQFLQDAKITLGTIEEDNFEPSICLRDYSKRKKFSPDEIPVDADPKSPLFEAIVVFTGKLELFTRDEARSAVVRIGGLAPERLTQETDYLVVGVQDIRIVGEKGLSGKMKQADKYKAKGLPIEIIDENDFLEMLGGDEFLNNNPELVARKMKNNEANACKVQKIVLTLQRLQR